MDEGVDRGWPKDFRCMEGMTVKEEKGDLWSRKQGDKREMWAVERGWREDGLREDKLAG